MTIAGNNFPIAPSVLFGGTAATDVTVVDAHTIRATTPAHTEGAVDVIVRAGIGTDGTLARGYLYVTPASQNDPPVLQSLTGAGSRPNEPSAYADVNEVLTITASVTDVETPVDKLVFDWASDTGSFSGSGRSVTWRAPGVAGVATLRLKITERYTTPGLGGLPVDKENVTTGSLAIDVHSEVSEIGGMAKDFLTLFSQSSVAPDAVMHNFQDGCGAGGTGKADERAQVVNNRQTYSIVQWSVGEPRVTVAFGGTSPFRARQEDAWAAVDAHWVSQCLKADAGCASIGGTRDDVGTDWVTARYDSGTKRWWLCDSDWDGRASAAARRYLR